MPHYLLNTLGESHEDLCILDEWVDELPMKSWMVKEGARVLPIYPASASIQMTETRLGLKLSSLLGTTKNMLVASKDFCELIRATCKNEIEFLPFTLYDHRKRPFSNDYCIVNPIGAVDCLDYAASGARYSREDATRVRSFQTHVLDRKKSEGAPELFRIKDDASELVVGAELWRQIHARKLSNVLGKKLPYGDGR